MNWFDLFFVISISVFVLSGIILGSIILYKLKQRKSVKATIFLKAGGMLTFWFNRDKATEKAVNNKTYKLNEKAVHKTRYRDHIFFLEDNPEPLNFDHEALKPYITSGELTTILDDNLLAQLFGSKELKTIQMLIVLCLITGVITMICVVVLLFGQARVKDTPELRQMIYNVTRSAIMGVPI